MADLKSCGVFLFREEPELSFLLMRHPDRWDLPKGHVDPGETELQCALREMREETSIPADAVQLDPEFRFSVKYTVGTERANFQPLEKELVVFIGKIVRPVQIQLTEHVDYQWFAWDPPHAVQARTIDPLLHAVARYWETRADRPIIE